MDVLDEIELACVYDAPMALKSDLSRTGGLNPRHAHARNKRHLYDLRKAIAGPLPVDTFVQQLVGEPYAKSDRNILLSARNAFKSVPCTANAPEEIIQPLLAALNKHTKYKSRCPGFVFENTARRSPHPRHPGYAKPHISCFTGHNVDIVRRSDRHSRSELGFAELFIQVTADVARDIFVDPPPGLSGDLRASFDFLSQRDGSRMQQEDEDALGLHIAFVTEVFARQHRQAYYTISMAGSRARLYRWDRAGCIVSEAFDIREHPEHLCEFLWRFSQTSDAARGHDPTVTPATEEEEVRFRDTIREYVRSQLELDGEDLDKALRQHYSPGHAAVVEVYPHHSPLSEDDVWQFIVSRPVISPLSLTGRGTRGYWAIDLTTSRVVFLKDTWRTFAEPGDDSVEGDLLHHLTTLGVRNVPSFVAHGDVPDYVPNEKFNVTSWQRTLTGKCAQTLTVCRLGGENVSVVDVIRYRLVMGDVGYGLSTVRSTEELLHVTHDAFTAMRDALSKDARIHRDISAGNIILVKVPGQEIRRGYLIDWESSATLDDAGESLRPGRAGTWYFMSWRMQNLMQAESRHTFLDDMESLVHLVLHCALLYLPHELEKAELVKFLQDYFEYSIGANPAHGGDFKSVAAHDRRLIRKIGFKSPALVEWVITMLEYQCPPGWNTDGFRYGERWTPEHIDAFWSEFLRTHALERDDRVVHDITTQRHDDFIPLSATPPTPPTTMPPPPPARKRSAEPGPSQDVPAAKRRRSLRLQNVPATPTVTDPPDGPRRSQRIRTIQSRAQAPPAAGAAPSNPRAPRTATRRAARGRGRGRSRR